MTEDAGRNCPICRRPSRYVFSSKHDRRIFHCQDEACGHFFTPVVETAQGVAVRMADLHAASDESLKIYDERNQRLLALFMRSLGHPPGRTTLLDFGAGDGHIARTFKRTLGDRAAIYCLEPNPQCEGFYDRYGLIQVASLGEVPEPIDLVYAVEVVEHLEDPVNQLASVKTVLSPAGRLFLSTPEGSSFPGETHAYDDPSHLHFFTPRSLNVALASAGFERIAFRYHPEMHPRPASLPGRLLHSAKNMVRPLARRLTAPHVQVGHLAGITRVARDR